VKACVRLTVISAQLASEFELIASLPYLKKESRERNYFTKVMNIDSQSKLGLSKVSDENSLYLFKILCVK